MSYNIELENLKRRIARRKEELKRIGEYSAWKDNKQGMVLLGVFFLFFTGYIGCLVYAMLHTHIQ